MKRYFFHICDDKGSISDGEGMDFLDDEAARREGEASARELLVDNIRSRQAVDDRRIEVMSEGGEVIATYRLRDLLN